MPQLPNSTSMSSVSSYPLYIDIDHRSLPNESKFNNIIENYEKIHPKKEQMIDFNIFYENLLGNQNNLYSPFFNESFNFCLNKVYHGKNGLNHQENNKSFSIDSILGFAANKDSGNDLCGSNQTMILPGANGFEYTMHQNNGKTDQLFSNSAISLKKISKEEHPKQDELKSKVCNKKLGSNRKLIKQTQKNLINNFGSNGNKSKRVRTIFTPEQLERLETEFEKQQYMVGTGRLYLASTLNLTEAQVKVWFQNRRIKWRKQHLEVYQENMNKVKNNQDHNNNEKNKNNNKTFIV